MVYEPLFFPLEKNMSFDLSAPSADVPCGMFGRCGGKEILKSCA